MKRLQYFLPVLLMGLMYGLGVNAKTSPSAANVNYHWVGTWATAPMVAGNNNNPPSPGLANNSLRQIVQVSIGGETVRLKLSNHFGTDRVEVKAVELALAKSAGSSSETDESTSVSLTFGGSPSTSIAAGAMAVSDPVAFNLAPRQNVAITIHYGSASSSTVCSHPGSRTTSYLKAGNTTDFTSAAKTDHWYHILALEVDAPEQASTIAVLGNSITDGRGSTTNEQNRWTDAFSRALLNNAATSQMGVLNLGIGGNCVLNGGLGPTGVSRAQRDLFEQEGVSYIILFEGVNDLGGTNNGVLTARRIIDAYRNIIRQAHAKGIRVIGATITPFKGNGYYSADHEAGRQKLNQWIKTSKMLDGVIDFAAAVCNPADPEALDSKYLFENDWLHLNASGYKVMGECIDLSLFTQTGPLADDDEEDDDEVKGIWIEAESLVKGAYGSNFALREDPACSGGKYLESVNNITASVSTNNANLLMADFTVDADATYYIYGLLWCPSYDDDSYWIQMDGGNWAMANGLFTGGSWQWMEIYKGQLKQGSHRLGIGCREDGARMDKLCITTSSVPPVSQGGVTTSISLPSAPEKGTEASADPVIRRDDVYDLQGRRLGSDHRSAVVIVNGKKSFRQKM